ncbi:FAD dependent oxidoreductase [Phlyctema vagabunda]|uniref:FAD dependent oxidoreductase n=1 Tax=Phlyctema vagabunda TaxID=108571 RepID=A0ABR4PBB0_9HELO
MANIMPEQFPKTLVIVGAGAFGLSTTLAISRRHPDVKVTITDRCEPPVQDGTSVDTSRILRPDYVDKEYEHLATKAQAMTKNDPDLKPYYFENGFTFCVDGEPSPSNTLWDNMLHNLKTEDPETAYDQCATPDAIYRHLHGTNTNAVPDARFPNTRKWVKGFTSKKCATVNSEAIIKVFYER